jgi:thiamine-phosphate pyrophosphorylase
VRDSGIAGMMELIVISSPHKKEGEVSDIIRMFEIGLTHFHLRKPNFSRKELKDFIEQIPVKYRNRIVLHTNHSFALKYKLGGIHISKKHRKEGISLWFKLLRYRISIPKLVVTRTCHKLGDLLNDSSKYSYVFLSPVFDSISVNSLSAGFSKRGLKNTIIQSKKRVYAMGGIEPQNFKTIAEIGFHGAALLGYIWHNTENRSEAFRSALNEWKQLD